MNLKKTFLFLMALTFSIATFVSCSDGSDSSNNPETANPTDDGSGNTSYTLSKVTITANDATSANGTETLILEVTDKIPASLLTIKWEISPESEYATVESSSSTYYATLTSKNTSEERQEVVVKVTVTYGSTTLSTTKTITILAPSESDSGSSDSDSGSSGSDSGSSGSGSESSGSGGDDSSEYEDTRPVQFTITYSTEHGKTPSSKAVRESTYQLAASDLPTLSAKGYIFKGWSYEENSTELIGSENLKYLWQDTTLYAVWEVDENAGVIKIINLASYLQEIWQSGATSIEKGETIYVVGSTDESIYNSTTGTETYLDCDTLKSAVENIGTKELIFDLSEVTGSYVDVASFQSAFAVAGGIVMPNSATKIADSAFKVDNDKKYYSLKSITFSDKITSIGDNAFYNCTQLENISLPETLESIGDKAFYGCTALSGITIPGKVASIGAYAFSNCTSLKTFDIPNTVTALGGVYNYTIFNENEAVSDDSVTPIETLTIGTSATSSYIKLLAQSLYKTLKTVTLKEGITEISAGTFSGCTVLESVNIPNSVIKIENNAFDGCQALKSITIPDDVTEIGEYAFQNCQALTTISIPAKVTEIGAQAFDGCSGLETAEILSTSITNLKSGLFHDCTSLTGFTVPESVTTIHEQVFDGCTSITEFTVGKNVTKIGKLAFPEYLKKVTFEDSENWSLAELYNGTYIFQTDVDSTTLSDYEKAALYITRNNQQTGGTLSQAGRTYYWQKNYAFVKPTTSE